MQEPDMVSHRPATDHPELQSEQAYYDRANEVRERRRRRLASNHSYDVMSHPREGGDFNRDRAWQLESLGPVDEAVAFGRIGSTDGDCYYIGRRAIFDEDQLLVISWKAPVASQYSRATTDDPMGVGRRRSYKTDGNQILDISDQFLDGVAALEPLVPRDALLRVSSGSGSIRCGSSAACGRTGPASPAPSPKPSPTPTKWSRCAPSCRGRSPVAYPPTGI